MSNQVDYALLDTPQQDNKTLDGGYALEVDDDFQRVTNNDECCGQTKMKCFCLTSFMVYLLAILLTLGAAFSNIQIRANDYSDNTSIYTQAIDDWTAKSWTEFTWSSSGNCN